MKTCCENSRKRSGKHEQKQLAAQFEAEAVPHLPVITRIARQLMRSQTEAEDLVQETFAQALQSFAHYQIGTNCRAWLCKIMFHKRSQHFRANNRFVMLDESANSFVSNAKTDLPPNFIGAKLSRALRRLPENHRQIILLCVVEELTYSEAAAVLRVPIGTVMSRLHRARKMLRAIFDESAANCKTSQKFDCN